MEFQINLKRESCRSGKLFVNEVEFETPMCLMYSRSGTIPHIATSNDLLQQNYSRTIQLTLPTLVDQPSVELVKKLDKGIHSFINRKAISFLTIQDPAVEPPIGYNVDKAVSVWTPGGRRKIDVQQFLSIVESFRPNVVECLCDTIPSDQQTTKRIQKSVDRTLKFLQEIVKHKEADKESQYQLLGAIEGSHSINERRRSAKETAQYPVSGFVLEGFSGCLGNWTELLRETTSELPEGKPRFIQGISSPDDVIKAIECGIDVFDSSFPYQVTERGGALLLSSSNKRFKSDHTHDQNTTSDDNGTEDKENTSSQSEYEINLKDSRFSKDFSPVDRCGCYCCTNHSRAYIHHLLVTKEMLAQVLLMTHNIHQYYRFFENIRQALNDGCWEDFKDRFNDRNR